MKVVYFSPHLDDAIFSCGGIIAHQVDNGTAVEVWSFFTADPPAENLTPFAKALHRRWGKQGNPYQRRREEDMAACRTLAVNWRHFGFADCIYRRYPSDNSPLVRGRADLFRPAREAENTLENSLLELIRQHLEPDDRIVLPLAVGGHIDHALVRKIGCRLENRRQFCPDYPYAGTLKKVEELHLPPGAEAFIAPLTAQEVVLWQAAAACYQSQISSFWKDREALERAIATYALSSLGATLWSFAGCA